MDDTAPPSQSIKEQITPVTKDHMVNVIKAVLATTPFAGGIASLMDDYIPSSKQKRLEAFAETIASDLKALQDRVQTNVILTDDFAHIFENCFRGVAENYQKEKIDAFRGILINSALESNLQDDEKEYFLNLVNTLSVLHVRVLKFMAYPTNYLQDNGISQNDIRGGFSQFFPIAIPNTNIEVIKSAFGDLYQAGFLNTDKSIFATMTSASGIELLGNGSRVTPLGQTFIGFCTSPCR